MQPVYRTMVGLNRKMQTIIGRHKATVCMSVSTVRLVSHDPAGPGLRNTLLAKESTYSKVKHIIVSALTRRGLPSIFDVL